MKVIDNPNNTWLTSESSNRINQSELKAANQSEYETFRPQNGQPTRAQRIWLIGTQKITEQNLWQSTNLERELNYKTPDQNS